jgi:hypothetical protein
MIDGNITEPTSLTESFDRPTFEKSGSFPCISGEGLTKSFLIETSITDQMSAIEMNEDLNDKQDGPAVVESSQATDKDLENTEFSLRQMSIDDIDSVSQDTALQSYQSTSLSQIDNENENIDTETHPFNGVQQQIEEISSPKKKIETSGNKRQKKILSLK